MARPYSMDLRERVVEAVEQEGLSLRQAADRFGIGIKTAIESVRRFHETGSLSAKPMGGCRPKKIIGQHRDWLLERCQEQDFTLRGLVGELAERGLQVDYRTVWDFVHNEKLTYKKDAGRPRARPAGCSAPAPAVDGLSEPHRPRSAGLHRRNLDQDQHGAASRVGALRTTVARQGATRPLEDHDLPGRSLRHDRVTAPWFIDGPIDGQSFLQYVEEVLVATLKPGDIVIFDNLGSHKGKAIRKAIRAAGAKLFFLPKYSPDLNPIEKFFAKLKHWLRKAARRTGDAVCHAVADVLTSTSPDECSNYFAQAGYTQLQSITL